MKKLEIKNYKCLGNVLIPDLKRVNLFTGKNNSGKSTILEALSLFAAKGNMNWIRQLLFNRGEIYNYREENVNVDNNLSILASFFSDRKIGFESKDIINISSDSVDFSLRFVKYIIEDIAEVNALEEGEVIIGKKRTISNSLKGDDVLYGYEVNINGNSNIFQLDRNIFRHKTSSLEPVSFHLVNAKGDDDVANSANLWDKITLTSKEDLVVDALKIIEPSISRLSFVGIEGYRPSRYPIVKLSNSENLYPLKAMGDGINRILNLTLALVNSDNGFLLIDECENGLHYSVQEKMWEIVFNISKKLNVQVFATTHSTDSINSFANVLEMNGNLDGSLYRLQRNGSKVIANPFQTKEIILASQQNIDLR